MCIGQEVNMLNFFFITILGYWILGVFSVVQISEEPKTSLAMATPHNASSLSGSNPDAASDTIIVYPKELKRRFEVDAFMNETIKVGKVDRLFAAPGTEGSSPPDILVWFIDGGDPSELEALRQRFGDAIELQPDDDVLDDGIVHLNSTVQDPELLIQIPRNLLVNETIIRQWNAPPDLRDISWPPWKPATGLNSYAYNRAGGEDSYVYIIDSGLDPSNMDFHKMPNPNIAWFYAPELDAQEPTDDSIKSHGSCVASLVAGAVNGVSKKSHLIMLKVRYDVIDSLWALSTALDDITDKGRQGKSVILFPLDENTGNNDTVPWHLIEEYMNYLFKADAVIVVPSGNNAAVPGRKQVDTLPAILESPAFPLIVAGAVDASGKLAETSQGPNHVTTWAPGVNVSCAKKGPAGGSQLESGTACSTALVAGLVAYYLGLPSVPFPVGNGTTAQNAKDFLRSKHSSWSRVANGPPVIWNGEDGSVNALDSNITIS